MRFQAAAAPGPSHRTEAFVLFRTEGTKRVRLPDRDLSAAANRALRAGEFRGEQGETLLLHGGRSGARALLAGLGPDRNAQSHRLASAAAARALEQRGIKLATFLVPRTRAVVRAVTEGCGLALYRFTQLKSKQPRRPLTRVRIAPESGGALRADVREASALVEAVGFARDLGNLPGNIAHAVYLAQRARALAGPRLSVRIYDRAEIKRMRMGAFGAVAQASQHEPRLIEFRYRGAPGAETMALVGKGVTFDTGGISLKPGASMEDMKFDMCGGAAVFGVMHALRALQPGLNVTGLVPATDNMPGGKAYRPGDILKARNGKTIEIYSTDAEGRLLLCDTLAYAAEKKPACIVDLATLTGACVVALADAACGLFGNDPKLVARLERAGQRSGETAWPMPLLPRYSEMLEGVYADLKNNASRWGGACTAAAFLKEFVGEVPWAHLDIAGVAWTDKDAGYHRRGATGYGVRLLWDFLTGKR